MKLEFIFKILSQSQYLKMFKMEIQWMTLNGLRITENFKDCHTWITSSLELKLDISAFLPSDTLVSEIHSLPDDNW